MSLLFSAQLSQILPSSIDLEDGFDNTVDCLLGALSSLSGTVLAVAVKHPEWDMGVYGMCDIGRRLSLFGKGPNLQSDQISSAGHLQSD